jgi:hypothetical protein
VRVSDTFHVYCSIFKREILKTHVGISGERTTGKIEKRKDIVRLLLMSKN